MVEDVRVDFLRSRCRRVVEVECLLIGDRIIIAIDDLGSRSGGHSEAGGEEEER